MPTRPTPKKTIVAAILLLLVIGCVIHVAWQRVVALQLESYGAKVTFQRIVLIGVKFLRDDATFSNEQMPLVARLPHLRWLDLVDTQVTDEGLQHVEPLPNLQSLTVRVDQISVERERHLSKRIGITKIRIIRGMRVADGYE